MIVDKDKTIYNLNITLCSPVHSFGCQFIFNFVAAFDYHRSPCALKELEQDDPLSSYMFVVGWQSANKGMKFKGCAASRSQLHVPCDLGDVTLSCEVILLRHHCTSVHGSVRRSPTLNCMDMFVCLFVCLFVCSFIVPLSACRC